MKDNLCGFCNGRASLLCDGTLANGKTCDMPICRQCAKCFLSALVRMKGECQSITLDLCPDCVAAGRTP
jgi:hypothetical protein